MYKILKAEKLSENIFLMDPSYGCTRTTCCKPLSARTIYYCEDGREGRENPAYYL